MKGGYIIVDTKCSDLSRLYYGGKELLYQDYTAVTNLAHVKALGASIVPSISRLRSKRGIDGKRINDYIPVSLMHSENVLGNTTSAITAIINGDRHKLREILHKGPDSTSILNKYTSTVCANMNQYLAINSFPLHLILDVPLMIAFRCILHGHEDIHPSAIIQQRKDGTYAYFCHGCYGEGKGITLIDLIMEATGCSLGDTVPFVEEALNIRLQTEHQIKCRSRCESILQFIHSADIRKGKWESLYTYMYRKKLLGHYRYYIERASHFATPLPIISYGVPTFYESTRETSLLMKTIKYNYCTGIDKDSIAKKRNELADIGLIGKTTNLDQPDFLKAKLYQEKMGYPHHKEFFFLPDLTDEILEFALRQINEAKNNGERARFKTRASILTSRGDEVVDRVFVQDAGKQLRSYQMTFIYFMNKTVSFLTVKGWTTEEEIIDEIIRTSNFKGVKWRIGQFRPLITNGERYTLETVNKELRLKLNLPVTIPIRKKIIVPINRVDFSKLDW